MIDSTREGGANCGYSLGPCKAGRGTLRFKKKQN